MTLSLWPKTVPGPSLRCGSCLSLVKHTLIVNDCLPSPLLLIFAALQVPKALLFSQICEEFRTPGIKRISLCKIFLEHSWH